MPAEMSEPAKVPSWTGASDGLAHLGPAEVPHLVVALLQLPFLPLLLLDLCHHVVEFHHVVPWWVPFPFLKVRID